MRPSIRCAAVVSVAAVAMLALPPARAHALINPKFTPVNLVRESGVILELNFRPELRNGKLNAVVKQVLKGKSESKSIEIDLTGTAYPDQARLLERRVKDWEARPVLMFIGGWSGKPGDQTGAPEEQPGESRKAYVHVEGMWLVLSEDDKGVWGFDEVSQPLVATWNGGTDMLLRAVSYILKDPAPEVPVKTGATWASAIQFARVPGKVSMLLPVDLNGDGLPMLFIASDQGDRLFAFTGKTFQDVTAAHKLQSRSLAAAWGDFNADGRLDLVSWDGKTLTVHAQDRDGTFTASPGGDFRGECTGLGAVDIGTPGKAGVMISTNSVPLLLPPGAEGVPAAVVPDKWPGGDLGRAGPCLAADFDGDGLCDILQLLARGSVLYRGVKPGAFGAPVACAVALGQGRTSACLGDWDADGLLDVFTTAEDGLRLWQNLGGGRFVESFKLSGELGYISKPGAVAGCTGDLNNDGRQDLVVLYPALAPQTFFNRGFRSFGISLSLDLERGELLAEAVKGQQAGCVADFTADGAQDLAMVLNDGQAVLLVRTPSGTDLCVHAILPPNSGFAGPVTVSGAAEDRPLGAWNVYAGGSAGFIARPDAGPVTIRWQFPGQKPQTRTVILEHKPVTFALVPLAPGK